MTVEVQRLIKELNPPRNLMERLRLWEELQDEWQSQSEHVDREIWLSLGRKLAALALSEHLLMKENENEA